MVCAGYLLLIASIILPKSFSCLVAQSEISRGEFKFLLQLFLQLLLSRQLFFAAVTNAAQTAVLTAPRVNQLSWGHVQLVMFTRDSNGISELTQIKLNLPHKISSIRVSLETRLQSLLAL